MYYNASCATYNKSSAAEMGDRGHMSRKDGAMCPFRGSWNPRLIQCGLGRGLLLYQLASSPIQPFGHKTGWGGCSLLFGRSWVHMEHKVAWAEAYLHTKSHHHSPISSFFWPRRTLAEKWGLCPFREGGTRSPSSTMSRIGRSLPPYQVGS